MWHFSKNWKDVPVVNHPSYRKYAPYVWTDAPDSVSSSWVCLPDWRTLWIQFVFDTVSWTVSRDFLFLNLLNTLKLFSWTMFSNSFVILPSFFFWTLWLLNICLELWASKLDTVFHIPFSISTFRDCFHSFSRTSYPNACSAENPLVSPSPFQIC